ncbi:Uu.00g061300.m01.CDS01 [Anthostomella pinea]|uniref:Uu.00g061300.m01.CDS01 n=1 Tax=Anthostomella pinea TaxID=933095 RepID=A0AAI8VSF5_9PEZI|nr:Uu.00g061300.m01.CDS01 [Anthostomella pinea]
MTSAFREEASHFEPDSPTVSVHGGRGGAGAVASDAPLRGSGDASSADHVQEKTAAATTLTKRQKVKRHCGRFKWWYVIGTIILLAILLPILFLVIIPAIVRNIVSKQSLPINGGTFRALSATQLSVSLSTELNTPLPADLDATTLFLYNKDTPEFTPFLNITLPKQHIDGKTDVVVSNQTVTITNETELVSWFSKVFDQPDVQLSVRGDATVRLGKLHSKAHIDKTVTASSLNQLSGFGIEHLTVILPAIEENGTNIQGTVNLPNSGVLTLGLGDISLNLMAGDVRIGLITLNDVLLPPGNNSWFFSGELFIGALVQNIGAVLASQGTALSDGNIQIDVTGNATVVNGVHIPFVEKVLNAKRISSSVPVVKLLTDLVGSFTGGLDGSVTDLVGEVFGNSTLIQDVLSHWNTTGALGNLNSASIGGGSGNLTAAAALQKRFKRAPLSVPKGLNGPAALNLLKLGMRMGLSKH